MCLVIAMNQPMSCMLNMLTFPDRLQDHVQSVTINKCIASVIDLDPDHTLAVLLCNTVLYITLIWPTLMLTAFHYLYYKCLYIVLLIEFNHL